MSSIMKGHTCYHCKQWVEEGEAHDCWTTTEAALTSDLSEDLREAWERLRETAAEFGEQRIYASHNSIMFARRSCYFFVRPKRSFLEVNVFLGRAVQAPQVRKVVRASAAKMVHVVQVRHRDEVEAPLTDWLEEAFRYSETVSAKGSTKGTKANTKDTKANTKGTKASTKDTKANTKGTKASTKGTKRAAKAARAGKKSTKKTAKSGPARTRAATRKAAARR
jgi:hypothetical protein